MKSLKSLLIFSNLYSKFLFYSNKNNKLFASYKTQKDNNEFKYFFQNPNLNNQNKKNKYIYNINKNNKHVSDSESSCLKSTKNYT